MEVRIRHTKPGAVQGVCVFIAATMPIILLSRYSISRRLRLAASGRIWCSSVSYNFPISGVMLTLKGFQLTSEELKSSGDGSDVIRGDCGQFKYLEDPVFCVFAGKVVNKWSCIMRTHKHVRCHHYLCKAFTLIPFIFQFFRRA